MNNDKEVDKVEDKEVDTDKSDADPKPAIKEKNPKRVEAGKKGAAAKKAKRSAEAEEMKRLSALVSESSKPSEPTEPKQFVTKQAATEEKTIPKANEFPSKYTNYIILCFVGIAGAYVFFNWRSGSKFVDNKPAISRPDKPREQDPFEFN